MKYYQQLKSILGVSGWSQEELAHTLGVSFVSLNAWLNERAVPRAKAQINIEQLYLVVVGVDTIDPAALAAAKRAALALRLQALRLAGSREALDRLTLHLTYHTNTIEGSTMTLADVEGVIFEHKVLANRTAVEQAEARNHQAALHWLVDGLARGGRKFVIDEELILGIHLRLMNGIMSDAGQFRRHSVRIMGSRVPLANWQRVPDMIAALANDLQGSGDDLIAALAETHARFEQIHPFGDGNGRTGRLIMVAQALRAGLVPPLVIKERKAAYYKYLELAQTGGSAEPLQQFIAESMLFTSNLLNGDLGLLESQEAMRQTIVDAQLRMKPFVKRPISDTDIERALHD